VSRRTELRLYYHKARFCSPTIGRFLQTEPVGAKDDLNLYAYVGNNSVNRVDPTGLLPARPQDKTAIQVAAAGGDVWEGINVRTSSPTTSS
jgi:RHS repeat-associated protein